MKFSELVEKAVECIKAYNPIVKTVDGHADEFLNHVITLIFKFDRLKIRLISYSFSRFSMAV